MVDHVAQQTPIRVGTVAVLATLGLLSAAFGFAAEATKPQLAEVLHEDIGVVALDGRCIYPSSITPMGLGATALLVLLLSRVYCPAGCCPATQSSYSIAELSRLLCWIAWLGGICFYVAGLIMMRDEGELEPDDPPIYTECKVVKPGIFGAGASFALASTILDIIYYLVVTFDRRLDESHKTTTDTTSTQLCKLARSLE